MSGFVITVERNPTNNPALVKAPREKAELAGSNPDLVPANAFFPKQPTRIRFAFCKIRTVRIEVKNEGLEKLAVSKVFVSSIISFPNAMGGSKRSQRDL